MKRKSDTKTTGIWGKGGNIRSFRYQGGLFYFIAFVLIFLIGFQPAAFASRSSAGGGEIAEPDWGEVATNLGITIGTMVITSALSSGFKAATPASSTRNMEGISKMAESWLEGPVDFASTGTTSSLSQIQIFKGSKNIFASVGNLLTNTPGGGVIHVSNNAIQAVKPWAAMGNSMNIANLVTGYGTFVAATQVNRAVGMAGSYYGWKPSNTFMISSFANAATAGFLNPDLALGDAMSKVTVENAASQGALTVSMPMMLRGAFVGGIGGLTSGAAIVAIDGSRINKGKAPGAGAQIAGLVAGQMGTQFGSDFVNHDTWHKQTETMVQVKKPLEAAREDFWGDVDYDIDELRDATNDIEADFTGNDALRTNYVEQDLAIIRDQYGERHTYFTITEKDGQIIRGAHIPDRVFNAKYGSDRYLWEPTGIPNVYRISDIKANLGLGTVLGRSAKGAFIGTFSAQSWPLLASRSLGTALSSKLSEDKQYLAPLISSLTQSLSHPLISSFAKTYGIDANRYFGNKFDKLEANIQYAYNARMMAKESILSETNAKMEEKREEYSAGKISLDEYRQALADLSIEKGKLFDSPDRYIKQLAAADMSAIPSERDKNTNTIVRLIDEKDSAKAIRNAALAQEGKRLETVLALDQSLPDALAKVGISKGDLFVSSALSGIRSGLFEGLISGGVETVFEKNTKNSNPTQKMLLSYAANMSTAALRGIAWDAGWQGTTDKYDWYDHWDYVKPQPHQETHHDKDGNLNPNFDLLAFKIGESTYDEDMLRYNRFLEVTGSKESPGSVPDGLDDKGVLKYKDVQMATLTMNEKFEDPIGASFAQANTEWINNAFSFGRPLTHYKGEGGFGIEPQQVSALRFMDYVGSLRNLSSIYSQGGLASVISHSFTQANLNAAANNIAGTLVQVPGVAGAFSLQPERLIKVTGAPQLLYTIQRASFHAGVTESIFRAPFPDPLYSVRPQTGEGDYLRRTQGSK